VPYHRPGIEIRNHFRPLVFWIGSATTRADGRAVTTVTLPDSLTTYRIMAVAGDRASRFGFGQHEIRVAKPLTLLPSLPRFLTTGDRADLGAVVANAGRDSCNAVVTIHSLTPDTLQIARAGSRPIRLGPGQSESVRFEAVAGRVGTARIRMVATFGAETDAFEMPIVVNSPARLETTAAYGDTVGTATEALTLPRSVLPGGGGLTVELGSTALVGSAKPRDM
jgi:uncharacterized protein YfaS (alpha-2-macroglobulin family)